MFEKSIHNTDYCAVVLAGGFGTRISKLIPGTPKPLANIAGKPFLEWVFLYLKKQGVNNIVLSTHHLASQIDNFVENNKIKGLNVACVKEERPLGTAGGFLNALGSVDEKIKYILVLNGDSLVLTNLDKLFHSLSDQSVNVAMVGVQVNDSTRYGSLNVDNDGYLCSFNEKKKGKGLINGGIYLFKREVIEIFPKNKILSFEYDIFPELLKNGTKIKVINCRASFIDIGTKDSLQNAGLFINDNLIWFKNQ